jgi:hypothetical protein
MSWHAGWGGPGWRSLPCIVQSAHKRHTETVELAQYADYTALVASSRSTSLLAHYLEVYLDRIEHWLRDWRIASNVSKSIAVLYVKTPRSIQRPRPLQFLGEPILWVETASYLRVILHIMPTWSVNVSHVGNQEAQRLGVLGPLRNSRSFLSVRNCVRLHKQLIRICQIFLSDLEVRCSQPCPEPASVTIHVSLHCD